MAQARCKNGHIYDSAIYGVAARTAAHVNINGTIISHGTAVDTSVAVCPAI